MPDQAPNIEPGKGRLVYDKTRRTIVAEEMDSVEKLGASEDYIQAYRRGIRVGRAELEREVAEWMIAHEIPTGHGDTLKDLLGELLCYFIDRVNETQTLPIQPST